MKNAIRLSMVAAVALLMTACGGGAKLGGGKQGAAEALFQASGPAASANGSTAKLLQSGATAGSITVRGEKSGSATLDFDVSDPDAASGFLVYNVKYDNFSDDGKNFYSGNMEMKFKFDFTQTSGSMALTLKGKINISGEISDFIDADVTQTVSFTALSEQSGTVNVTLNGRIATSTETHTYNNEQITFTADGELPAKEEA